MVDSKTITRKKTQPKYKKAPQAPRRFKSAYMFFSTEKHKSIREELLACGRSEKTTEIAKLVSRAWKSVSDEERMLWEEKARQDKARFQVEKSHYTGPWKVPRKKRMNSDARIPKRPMSAFLAFSHANRAEEKKKHPNLTNNEITRILAEQWKNAQDHEKERFIEEERALRQKYLVSIALWRHSQKKTLLSQRQEREEMALKEVTDREKEAAAESFEYCSSNYDTSGYHHCSKGKNPVWSTFNSQNYNDVPSSIYGSRNIYEDNSLATNNGVNSLGGYEEYPYSTRSGTIYPTHYSLLQGTTYHEEISPYYPSEEGSSEYYDAVREYRGYWEKRMNFIPPPTSSFHDSKSKALAMSHGDTAGVASFTYPTSYPMQYSYLSESEKRIKNEILWEYPDFRVPVSRKKLKELGGNS